MLGILDRYVLGHFLKTYVMVVVVVLMLFVLVDLTNRVRRFNRAGCGKAVATKDVFCPHCGDPVPAGSTQCPKPSPTALALQYYSAHVPVIFYNLSPFLVVLAGMMTIAGLRARSELIPMRVAGRGAARIAVPIYGAALLLGALSWSVQEHLIPQLRDLIERSGIVGKSVEVHPEAVPDSRGGVLFVGSYIIDNDTMRDICYQQLDAEGREILEIHAVQGNWDPRRKIWTLSDGVVFEYDAQGRRKIDRETGKVVAQRFGENERIFATNLLPRDIYGAAKSVTALSSAELRQQRDKLERNRTRLQAILDGRQSYPLAGFVLLLLGLPFVFDRASNTWAGLITCLVICGAFYVMTFFLLELAKTGRVPSLAAAWAPNLIFAAAGAWLTQVKGR